MAEPASVGQRRNLAPQQARNVSDCFRVFSRRPFHPLRWGGSMNVIRFLLCVRHARTHTENALDPQIKHRKSPQIRQASRSEGFWHLLFSACGSHTWRRRPKPTIARG